MRVFILLSIAVFSFSGLWAQEDWTLEKCIAYANEQNIEIKQSELQLETAEINKTQAIAALFPTLNASGGIGWNWGRRIDPFTNQFATNRVETSNIGVNAGLTIFNGFQNSNNLRQSSVDYAAKEAYLEQMRYDVSLNIANAYLSVLFNEELLKIANTNLQGSDQQLARISKLVAAGSLPMGNLSEIQSQVAADEAKVVIAENNLDIAYLALTQLMNMPYEEGVNLRVLPPDLEMVASLLLMDSPEPAIGTALNNFPRIQGAKSDLESAEIGYSISKGTYSPRLSLSYSYGSGFSGNNKVSIGDDIVLPPAIIGITQGSQELVQTLNPITTPSGEYRVKNYGDQLNDNLNSSLFLSLSIPIFNGLSSRSNVNRARVGMESAAYNLQNSELKLSQEVQRAWTDARAAMKNFQAAEKAVEASEIAFDYATVRFEQGAINTVEYSDARVRLDNAKAELIRNKYAYLFKVKVLDYYQGQPLTLQ